MFKKGIGASSEFQNASVFLDAVYGSEGKEKYKWATNEANKTPFEEGEVASGLARAHSLNLKDDEQSFKMYEDLGSFAKIQGVGDLSSAIDAISDAQGGEWERLQTITGTKRAALEEFAKQNNLGEFTNKKGQVTDKDKLMDVLKKYMDDKGITGMTDKFSKTFDGRLSTLQGNIKKSISKIMGITEDGTIKDGSLFDNASKGIETLINSVNKFAESDSADKVGEFLGNIGSNVSKFLDYLSNNPDVVDILLKTGGALVGLKVVSSVISPINSLTKLIGGTGKSGLIGSFINASNGVGMLTKSLGLLAVGVGLAHSAISDDGFVHKGVNSVLNNIAGNDENHQTDYLDYVGKVMQAGGLGIQQGLAYLMGNDTQPIQNQIDSIRDELTFSDKFGNGKIYTDDEKDKWYTNDFYPKLSDSYTKNADYAKSTIQAPNINFNIDTVKETADMDDLMRRAGESYYKYVSTRNQLD